MTNNSYSKVPQNDLTGKVFGKLTVLEKSNETRCEGGYIYWLCLCECGNEVIYQSSYLRSGNIFSCGCKRLPDGTKDMTGQVFGRLLVVEKAKREKRGVVYWRCICDCGTETIKCGSDLRRKSTRSCGCLARETLPPVNYKHGQANNKERVTKTKTYSIWGAMMGRCHNLNNQRYEHYGARGIKVCDRWRNFENFFEDMGHPPTDQHSIDRINVDGNYEPSNCRWASKDEQRANQRKVSDYTRVTLQDLESLKMYSDENVCDRIYVKLTKYEKMLLKEIKSR